MQISPAQIQQYRNEGFFTLESCVPQEHLDLLRSHCQYFIDRSNKKMDEMKTDVNGLDHRNKRYFVAHCTVDRPQMRQFVFSDLMASICRATIGEDAYLFWDQYVVKCADQGMKFSWHQDSGYVKWYDPRTNHKPYVTCWCTLDAVNEENGTVYMLPYKRAGGRERIEHHFKEEGSNDLIGYTGSDPGDPLIVPAGSIVAFDSFLFHRSGANRTNRMRRIYLPQYSGAPIPRPDGKPWAMATPFLKDGKNVYDHAGDTEEKYGPFADKKKETI